MILMTKTRTAVICAAAISVFALTALNGSGSGGTMTVAARAQAAQPATGGGTGGGGGTSGGGKTPAVVMPADWPTAVAVPPGQLYGVSAGAKDPQWVLGLIGQGNSAQYIASVDALYTAVGYTLVGGSPYVLTNVTFTITVGLQPNDHSATTTLVAFQLHRN